MESSPPNATFARAANPTRNDAWHHAVRVAFLTSLVAAATGVILYGLVGLSAWVVVPVLVFGGWLVGCHLPPAAPAAFAPGPRGGVLTLVEDSGDRSDEGVGGRADDLAA